MIDSSEKLPKLPPLPRLAPLPKLPPLPQLPSLPKLPPLPPLRAIAPLSERMALWGVSPPPQASASSLGADISDGPYRSPSPLHA